MILYWRLWPHLQPREGLGHGDGVHTPRLAEVSAEVTRRRTSLLLVVHLSVERGVCGGGEGSRLPLPESPGPGVLHVTQALTAHSGLPFETAERGVLGGNIEYWYRTYILLGIYKIIFEKQCNVTSEIYCPWGIRAMGRKLIDILFQLFSYLVFYISQCQFSVADRQRSWEKRKERLYNHSKQWSRGWTSYRKSERQE